MLSQTPKCTPSACNLCGYNVSLLDSRTKKLSLPKCIPHMLLSEQFTGQDQSGGMLERSKKKLVSGIQSVSLRLILLVLILNSYPIFL